MFRGRSSSVVVNTIVDNSGTSTTNGGITVNGAERNITIPGKAISYLNQASNFPSGILLQLGTNDANIAAASQNFCKAITVDKNTIVNRQGTRGTTTVGINLQQIASGCIVDQIVIANNAANGMFDGILMGSTSPSNGITHAHIHGNAVEGNTTGVATDGKTYASVFFCNNSPNTNDVQGFALLPEVCFVFRDCRSRVCGDSTAHRLRMNNNKTGVGPHCPLQVLPSSADCVARSNCACALPLFVRLLKHGCEVPFASAWFREQHLPFLLKCAVNFKRKIRSFFICRPVSNFMHRGFRAWIAGSY